MLHLSTSLHRTGSRMLLLLLRPNQLELLLLLALASGDCKVLLGNAQKWVYGLKQLLFCWRVVYC